MSLSQLYLALLAAGTVLLVAIAAARMASRLGLPSLLLFLALGVALGEDGLGLPFDDFEAAQALSTAALAMILIEGGLTTRWSDIRRLLTPAGVLATVGVALSVLVTGLGAHLLLGMEWQTALLLGAIVSSTDAAATFAVLRSLPLPRKVAGLLEAESGFNDAPTIILVLVFASPQAPHPGAVLGNLLFQLVVGGLVGLVTGRLGALALRRTALPAAGLYPLATVGFGVIAFAAAGAMGASGIIAAFLAGLVLGNSALPHRASTRSFAEGAGWLAQIGLFVMLGLLVDPSELLRAVPPALVVGLVLLLVARPVSVVACLLPFPVPWRERVFVSWAGLRGAVPIVLSTFPVVAGVPDSLDLLNIVFVLVVVFTLVQGPTLPAVARWLRIIGPAEVRELQVEAAPLDVLNADLLVVEVPPGSRLHGVTIRELRLPSPSVVSLVIREETAVVPETDTPLQEGDELLVITTATARADTERRLRAVARRGALARWLGDDGEVPSPSVSGD